MFKNLCFNKSNVLYTKKEREEDFGRVIKFILSVKIAVSNFWFWESSKPEMISSTTAPDPTLYGWLSREEGKTNPQCQEVFGRFLHIFEFETRKGFAGEQSKVFPRIKTKTKSALRNQKVTETLNFN